MLKKVRDINGEVKGNIRGSVSVEAAIVMPVIACIFLFFFSMMNMVYTHGKIQIALNEVCKDLTYDSYVMSELGIIQVNKAIYGKGLNESVTTGDLIQLYEEGKAIFSTPQSNFTIVNVLDVPEKVSKQHIEKTVNEKINMVTWFIDIYEGVKKVPYTLGVEAGYYMNTMMIQGYVREKLKEKLKGVHVEYEIVHASGFLENEGGSIILRTEYSIPILLKKQSVYLKNGGYFHRFTGAGEFRTAYNEWDSDSNEEESKEKEEEVVYVTEKGVRYHKDKHCFHIRVKVNTISYNQIGNKRICDYCRTKEVILDENTQVFTTKNSSVFHTKKECQSINHKLTSYSEKNAIGKGYTPCKTCSKK